MSYVTTQKMLEDAQKRGYAVGAFNTENMEGIQAAIWAAEELRAPIIIQTTPSMTKYASPKLYHGMVYALAQEASVPVALHLDHGSSAELAQQCVEAGYSSIMIDGSALPLQENAQLARRVVQMCASHEIAVEAELGKVGGKEDDLDVKDPGYTDPQEAQEFVRESGIASLAVAIGTAHGFYAGTPVLDKSRLDAIRKCVSIPLVLHGASGLSDEDVRDCVARGICKVNFATELRAAYTQGVREAMQANPHLYDPKEFGKAARECVKRKVMERILVCGADGKA